MAQLIAHLGDQFFPAVQRAGHPEEAVDHVVVVRFPDGHAGLAQPPGVGATLIAQIFDAIGKIEAAGGTVDAILMNPTDYAAMLLAEYTTNQYNVLVQGERFGQYRIIRTSVVAADSAVVGDFSSSVELYVGEAANVQATEALGFKNNIVTIRAEMDAVVLVTRPWLLYKCAGATP